MKKNSAILLTNDDGYGVDGLALAVRAVKDMGSSMVVVPNRNRSGLSHQITMRNNIAVRRIRTIWSWTDAVYAIDGTPADCVRLGVFTLSKKRIRLIISGVNHGANMGEDVIYSGTVAAAREGAMLGIPSMAVSVASRVMPDHSAIIRIIRTLAQWIIDNAGSSGIHFNINIPPDITVTNIRFVYTRLGKRIYGTKYIKKRAGNRVAYLLKEKISGLRIPGTDIDALTKGHVSITPLTLQFTDEKVLRYLKKKKILFT